MVLRMFRINEATVCTLIGNCLWLNNYGDAYQESVLVYYLVEGNMFIFAVLVIRYNSMGLDIYWCKCSRHFWRVAILVIPFLIFLFDSITLFDAEILLIGSHCLPFPFDMIFSLIIDWKSGWIMRIIRLNGYSGAMVQLKWYHCVSYNSLVGFWV